MHKIFKRPHASLQLSTDVVTLKRGNTTASAQHDLEQDMDHFQGLKLKNLIPCDWSRSATSLAARLWCAPDKRLLHATHSDKVDPCLYSHDEGPTAEEDEEEEDEPGHGVGHDEAAPDGAHAAEQVDGRLVRQEADQPEAEVPARRPCTVMTYQHIACVQAWILMLVPGRSGISYVCRRTRPRACCMECSLHVLLQQQENAISAPAIFQKAVTQLHVS